MHTKILTVKQAEKLSADLHVRHKSIVLAGGCFDVLHPGHVIFLERAKKAGDYLLLLLESDEKIRQIKGEKRPVHNRKERALILSSISFVDFIVCMPFLKTDLEYDELILKIKPDIIAATKGDKQIAHKKRAAGKAGAGLVFVTKMVGRYSTSRILVAKN